MEEVKPIVLEKFEFHYRDMSKLMAFLDYQDFDAKNKIDDFFNE